MDLHRYRQVSEVQGGFKLQGEQKDAQVEEGGNRGTGDQLAGTPSMRSRSTTVRVRPSEIRPYRGSRRAGRASHPQGRSLDRERIGTSSDSSRIPEFVFGFNGKPWR